MGEPVHTMGGGLISFSIQRTCIGKSFVGLLTSSFKICDSFVLLLHSLLHFLDSSFIVEPVPDVVLKKAFKPLAR